MKNIQTYRMEHQSLMNHMERVHHNLELARWKQGQTHVQQFLAAVASLKDEVLAHTFYEDRDFYPWVRTLKQEQVLTQVERLHDDLFPIDRAFDAFLTIWTPRQILDSLDEFETSLRELTELLKGRISGEEQIFAVLEALNLDP